MTKRKASCEETCCKRPKKCKDQILWVNEIDALKRISEDAVQLVVWRQKQVPEFCKKLDDLLALDLPQFEGVMKPGVLKEVLKAHLWCHHNLRSRKNRACEKDVDQLVQHISDLAHSFAEIFKESDFLDSQEYFGYVAVKLQVIEDDGCCYWHKDSVPYRLVVTYRGACTEYIPPAYSKATLSRRKLDSKHAKSLTHKDVAIFKGLGNSINDGNEDEQPGIVHRSPRYTGESRLILVLDIPHKGWHYN